MGPDDSTNSQACADWTQDTAQDPSCSLMSSLPAEATEMTIKQCNITQPL